MFTTSDCARKFSTEREKYFLASQLEGNLVYLLVSFPALPQRVRGMGRIFKSGSPVTFTISLTFIDQKGSENRLKDT